MTNKYAYITVFVLLFITMLVFPSPVYATEGVKIFCKGQEVVFDQSPLIEHRRMLVPVRAIAETIGMKVDYNSSTKTATLTRTEHLLKIPTINNSGHLCFWS